MTTLAYLQQNHIYNGMYSDDSTFLVGKVTVRGFTSEGDVIAGQESKEFVSGRLLDQFGTAETFTAPGVGQVVPRKSFNLVFRRAKRGHQYNAS